MTAIEQARAIIEDGKQALAASSCTFYVQDPLWHDDWRLLFWPGVKYQEPMHGFIFPESAKRVIVEGEPEIFSAYATTEGRLRGNPVRLQGKMTTGLGKRLFGDFVEREAVKSSARLLHHAGKAVDAILFVNFAKHRDFSSTVRETIRALMSDLCQLLRPIAKELEESDSKAVRTLLRIMHPSYELSALRFQDEPASVQRYFKDLLDVALAALGISARDGFGTVSLYDPDNELLSLEASRPDTSHRTRSDRLLVRKGQGVISWVALRGRAILIPDLRHSDYRSLHRQVAKTEMRSQLAVPMIAGGQVLGVLNLESAKPNKFKREDVRAIWYAANKAAVALQLSRHDLMIRERKRLLDSLWEILGSFTTEEHDPESVLKKLLQLARGELRADECEVWPYGGDEGKFGSPVGTYQMSSDGVRPDGWTQFIVVNRCPVWISKIKDAKVFDVDFWDRTTSKWEKRMVGRLSEAPETMNHASVVSPYGCELGLPVMVKSHCTGVVWLKFRDARAGRPGPEVMPYAIGFAELGALIIELRALVDRIAARAAETEMKASLGFADGPLALDGIVWLEAYVKRRSSESRLGGDFHATEILDPRHVGIWLGDAEGHGVTGILRMLPLITAFRLLSEQTVSCKHLMVKLDRVAGQLQCRGSGVYCMFAREGSGTTGRVQLFACSAGNVELRILRRTKDTVESIPHEPKAATIGLGYSVGPRDELVEDRFELDKGDVVIGFTDGITDARAKNGELFGRRRILQVAQNHDGAPPKIIAEAVFDAAMKHADGLLEDDATVLVVRIRE